VRVVKLKDITESSGRLVNLPGSLGDNAAVEYGVLVDSSRWGMIIVGL
jgi:hypothetical protein